MNMPNLPFWSQSQKMTVVHLPGRQDRKVKVKNGYWRLRLIEMRLGRDWVFTSILHPAMFVEYIAFDHVNQIIVGPKQFGAMRGDLRLVHLAPQVVVPPLPFNGLPYDVRVALLSVPGKDLAEGMLNLLADLSDLIGGSTLTAAIKLTNILREGINTIIGLDDCKMQLGWTGQTGQFDEMQQEFVFIAPPSNEIWSPQDISIVGGKLQFRGHEISRINYLMFALEVAERRQDWHELPGIKDVLSNFNVALGSNIDKEGYQKCAEALLIAIRTSPYLVENQRIDIINSLIEVKKKTEEQKRVLMRADLVSLSTKVVNDINETLMTKGNSGFTFEESI